MIVFLSLFLIFISVSSKLSPSELNALQAMKVVWGDSVPRDWVDVGEGCSWTGIFCSESGHVLQLKLNGFGLTGVIPVELSGLTYLQELKIGLDVDSQNSNSLKGSIPSELGNLANLSYLDLSSNVLVGVIPRELGQLTKLTYLGLSDNKLAGPIPPDIVKVEKLVVLDLSYNALTDSIPPELGQLANLSILFLQHNYLTGPIPTEIGNLTMLTWLYLHFNSLSCSIPPELGQLKNLTELYLHVNHFNGTIPPELGKLTKLKILGLYWNYLSGSIPPDLGRLRNIERLFLAYNFLSGSIPPEFGNMSELRVLDIGYNSLSGSVPSEFGLLRQLKTLYLQGNILGPSFDLYLEDLRELDISSNSFLNMTSCSSQLTYLNASGNPGFLFELHSYICSSVRVLDVSATGISVLDNICHFFPEVIDFLALSNGIESVPFCFNELDSLVTLNLRNNSITGDSFGGAPTYLLHLNLEMNRINKIEGYGFMKLLAGLVFLKNGSEEICNSVDSIVPYLSVLLLSRNDLEDLPLNIRLVWCNSPFMSPVLSLTLIYMDASDNALSNVEFPFSTDIQFLDLRGNPQLDIAQLLALVPSVFYSSMTSSFVPRQNTSLTCKSLATASNHHSNVLYDASMSNYSLCRCAPEYFGSVHACRSCANLPHGSAVCDASTGRLMLENGFYPQVSDDNIDKPLALLNVDLVSVLLRCPVADSCSFNQLDSERKTICFFRAYDGRLVCEGAQDDFIILDDGVVGSLCTLEYRGRLCSMCAADFYRGEERKCMDCPGPHSFKRSNAFLVILVGISLFVIAMFVIMRGFGAPTLLVEIIIVAMFVWMRIAEGWVLTLMMLLFVIYSALQGAGGSEGLAKSLMFYLQTLSSLAPAGIFSELFDDWNPFSILSFANFHPFGLECFHSLEFLAEPDFRLGFTMVLPLICVGVAAIVVLLSEMILWIPLMRKAVLWYEMQRSRLLSIVNVKTLAKKVEKEFLSGADMSMDVLELEEEEEKLLPVKIDAIEDSPLHLEMNQWTKLAASVVHACLFVLYAVYFEVAGAVLAVFHPDGYGYMGAPYEYLYSPYTEFGWENEPQARTLLILGSIGLVGFVAFIPLLYMALLAFFYWRSFSHGDFHGPAAWIGFLYEGFRQQIFWYEFVWLGRRLLLAVFLAVIPDNSIWSPLLILLLLFASLLLHSYVKPFESHWENAIERLSLLSLLFTFMIGQLLEPGALLDSTPPKGERWEQGRAAFVAILVLNAFVVIGYVLVFASNYLKALCAFLVRIVTGKELSEVAQKMTINREQQLELEVRQLRAENSTLRKRSGFVLEE